MMANAIFSRRKNFWDLWSRRDFVQLAFNLAPLEQGRGARQTIPSLAFDVSHCFTRSTSSGPNRAIYWGLFLFGHRQKDAFPLG